MQQLAQQAASQIMQAIPEIHVSDTAEDQRAVVERVASKLVSSLFHVARADKQHDVQALAGEVGLDVVLAQHHRHQVATELLSSAAASQEAPARKTSLTQMSQQLADRLLDVAPPSRLPALPRVS